jgi:hypothetical protein
MRGCREGGVPEAILQSRSYRQQYGGRARASRGTLWTIDYDVVLPDGRWRPEVVVVRAMSATEAVSILRAKLARGARRARAVRVHVEAGQSIHRPPYIMQRGDVSRFPPFVIQYKNREGYARSLAAYDLMSARRLLRKAKRIDPRATLHGEA